VTEAYQFLAKGGILMVPILLCSVLALAIFLERLWALRRVRVLPEVFLQKATRLIHTRDFDKARDLCERSDSSMARVLAGGLRHAGKDRAFLKEIMEEVGRREATWLERGIGVLGMIANIAPLLGLLGTVTGMIRVFQQVVAQAGADGGGQVNAGALANGIWEALITTAAGLAVAIPTFVMFKILTGRIDALLVELEERSLDLAESMVGGAPPPTSPAPATPAATEPNSPQEQPA
jgi:biopolymer transport protein ExbB